MTVVIQYAQTVKVCLEEVKGFLVKTNQDPKAVIVGVIEGFEAQIGEHPFSGPICPELLKIGCSRYREYNTPDGYRMLYAVEGKTVTVHAILAQRQDIHQLLFRRLVTV